MHSFPSSFHYQEPLVAIVYLQIHPDDAGCVDAICAAKDNDWFSRLSSLDLMVRSGTHLTLLKVVVALATNIRSFALNSTVDLDEGIVRSVLQWNDFERLIRRHLNMHQTSSF